MEGYISTRENVDTNQMVVFLLHFLRHLPVIPFSHLQCTLKSLNVQNTKNGLASIFYLGTKCMIFMSHVFIILPKYNFYRMYCHYKAYEIHIQIICLVH